MPQHSRTGTPVVVDVASTVDEYLDRSDWRVNANANQGYSLGGLILNTAGKVIAGGVLVAAIAAYVNSQVGILGG